MVTRGRRPPVVDEAAVRAALADVADPEIPRDLDRRSRDRRAGRGGRRRDPGRAAADVRRLPRARRDRFGRRGAAGRLRAPGRGALRLLRPVDDRPDHGTGTPALAKSGFAPPGDDTCPYCGSANVLTDNLFGPTQCRSVRYCRSCRQPFEAFKLVYRSGRRDVDLVDTFRGMPRIAPMCRHIDREARGAASARPSITSTEATDPGRALETVDGSTSGGGPFRPDRPLSYREAVHEPHGLTTWPAPSSASWAPGRWARGSPRSRSRRATRSCCTTSTKRRSRRGRAGPRRPGRRAAKLELDADSIDEWVDGRLANLRTAVTLDAVAAAADIVIEAALEDLDLKRTIFGALDREAPPDALLATNTSALSVAAIAIATSRPEHVLGLHFFNPAPLMPLVEVVRGPQTDADSVERAVALMERWGKTPVVARTRRASSSTASTGRSRSKRWRCSKPGRRASRRSMRRCGRRATRWARSS